MAKPRPSERDRGRREVRPETPGGPGRSAPGLTFSDGLNWREPFVVPLTLMLMARAVYAYFIPPVAEDAYITFRYALHFAHGRGLVFNPGEHVMGFTSPLWTMWMSLGFLVHADPILWARTSAITADAVTLVIVAALLRQTVSRSAGWCFAIFFALWPYFSGMTASGMESGIVLMLIALSAVLVSRRHGASAPALALLALSRPEGFVAAVLLAMFAKRRHALIAAAITALALVPLGLYFGTVIPQSVFAKSRIYGTPGPWAGRVWWMWLFPRPFTRAAKVVEEGHLVVLAVIFTPALFMGIRRLWPRRREAISLLVAVALVVWAAYALLGVAYFYWYLMVPLVGLAILAAAGLPSLVKGVPLYASIIVFLGGVYLDGLQPYWSRSMLEIRGFGGVADYLNQHAHPGERVFLEPIGMIGFSCPLVIVDEVGLVSPEVAKRRLEGPGWYTDTVTGKRPEWLVARAGLFSSGAAWAGAGAPFRSSEEEQRLLAAYEVADTVEADRGEQALLVLHRR